MLRSRYRMQRQIKAGDTSQVWAATDMRLDRRVAVKVLDPEFSADLASRDRLRQEAYITVQFNHPGIVAVYDYGEAKDPQGIEIAYMVMELVPGEPLDAVLGRLGRLSVLQALDMLEQAGRALGVAHAAGVIHHDIEPSNILVTPTGVLKLIDFGIAQSVGSSSAAGTHMGPRRAHYLAPEQALGEEETAASDMYSLGIIGYQALTGRRPFTGDGVTTIAMKHVRDAPCPMPPDLPANVRELIEIALSKEPTARYATGGEFGDAVAAVRDGRRPPPPLPIRPDRRGYRLPQLKRPARPVPTTTPPVSDPAHPLPATPNPRYKRHTPTVRHGWTQPVFLGCFCAMRQVTNRQYSNCTVDFAATASGRGWTRKIWSQARIGKMKSARRSRRQMS